MKVRTVLKVMSEFLNHCKLWVCDVGVAGWYTQLRLSPGVCHSLQGAAHCGAGQQAASGGLLMIVCV